MAGIILIFVINYTKLSAHMAQSSEDTNSANQKNHSHDQMGKMIAKLSNKTLENNNNSTGHFNQFRNRY